MIASGFEDFVYRSALPERAGFVRIPHGIEALLRRARERHATRRAVRQLLAVDGHLLRDIGLTRADAAMLLRDPDRRTEP